MNGTYPIVPSSSTIRYLLIIGILSVLGGIIFSRFPALSVGGISVRTSFFVALVAATLLISTAISKLQSGKQRAAVAFGTFGAGILLSQLQYSTLPTLGILSLLLCAGIGWEVDRRLLSMISHQ